MLHELRSLVDPRDGRPLLERTVLIANTSNMPVMAREACIHAGLTVAEHYRDMGLDVVVIADSTSRWAEALRELASRTDELPAEEGYPARLSSAIAAFYARAGRVRTLGGDEGSVTILGAVSPPGNDLTEPVTAHTRRSVRCVWSLDRDLAYARHYPAVTWRDSSSRDAEALARWQAGQGDADWSERRRRAVALLDEADRRQVVADLVGATSLPARERLTLWAARLLRDLVLRQSALNPNEAYLRAGQGRRAAAPRLDAYDAVLALSRPRASIPRRSRRSASATRCARATSPRPATRRPSTRRARRLLAATRGTRMTVRIEYESLAEIRGPLLVVEGVSGVGWDEVAEIRLGSGERRNGVVLDVHGDLAVVEVLEGTSGLRLDDTRVSFTGAPMEIPVGTGWLGRVCNGRGEPIDGGPPIAGSERREIAGRPINPVSRAVPRDAILTGISAVDGLASLVRGQKLPIFSVGGLPHLELASQIAAQASAGDEPFAVVFAAMGVTHADAAAVRDALEERAARGDLALLLNTADDPTVERIVTPRIALTIAEHLAFDLGRHVLVVMADLTSYCDALREVSAARGEIPSRRGYPGYLYSDLASLLERAGRVDGRPGSHHAGAGADDAGRRHDPPRARRDRLHHRGPARALAGARPPRRLPAVRRARVALPPDAARRRARRTRDDHLDIAAQVYGLVARARQIADLAEIIGADALVGRRAPLPRLRRGVRARVPRPGPRTETRTIDETLDRAWAVASRLPRVELDDGRSRQTLETHYRRWRCGFPPVEPAACGSPGASPRPSTHATCSSRNAPC